MNIATVDQPSLFIEKDRVMYQHIQQFDWSGTPVGEMAAWPYSLTSAIDTLLSSSYPTFLIWGSTYTFFYNDAAVPLLKPLQLPASLYTTPSDAWPAMWNALHPTIVDVLGGEPASFLEEMPLPIDQNGVWKEAYWNFGLSRLKNETGVISGVMVTCIDVTSKVLTQRVTLNTKNELQEALDACELGIWDLDPITMVFHCNQKTKAIFGLPGDQYVDLQVAIDMIELSDRPRIKEAIGRALQVSSGGSYDVAYTVYPPQGEKKIVKAKGKAYFNEAGQPVRFLGTLQDVTVEEGIRRRQEKLQQLVENAKDYMSMANLEGQMTYMNKVGRSMTGLAADANLSQLHLKDFYSEQQFEIVKNEIIPALEERGYWSGVVSIKHQQTGEEIPCYGNYMLVHDPVTNQVISRALMLRDLRAELIAQKELEDSEKRFRNLVQEAPVATAIYTGPEMKIQWANDAMIKLWGKEAKAIGQTIREALPELEGQPFHDLLDHVYASGEMYQTNEGRADLLIDGMLQTFYFNYSYKPLRDTEGKIYGILNMAIDVTEQVFMKRRLEESERNFRSLIMQAPIGICLLSGDNFIVEVANDQYLELAGRTREESMNRPIWELLPEAKAQGFDRLLGSVRESGQAYVGNEHPITLMRNGKKEYLHVNFVYEPLFAEDGKAHSILVIAIDVTQQVKARQAIEDAEERARIAVESARLGAYEINLLTREVIPSARFLEICDTEYTAGHYDYISKLHPDDLHLRIAAHETALQTGKLEYESRLIRSDDIVTWVRISGQYYFNEQKQPYKIIGIIQDITQQKTGEEELERRVKERTAALVRLNDELQQFTYVSSHDLKEPLRKIHVFADAIQVSLDRSNTRLVGYVEKIKLASSRMSSLLTDLLNYSLLSNTDNPYSTIDLNAMVEHIEGDIELMIQDKAAVITKENLPVIEGISFQINQLLFNIITNAIKFSKPDVAPFIMIRGSKVTNEEKATLKLSPSTGYYRIDITDNGIGFNQEASEKIFVVFQRLHDRTQFTGNGIGLSICKKIIENHKGSILAHSTVGVGSTFSLILPQYQLD